MIHQTGAVDPTCQSPTVAITNLGTTTANATKVQRSESYIVQTSATLRCNNSDTKFTWNIWPLQTDSKGGYIINGVRKEVATGTSEWTIKKLDLATGMYLVSYQITMTKNNAAGIDFKYLSITPSKLLAEIAGGSIVKRGFNKDITLDGSPSRDPDLEVGKYDGMVFTWLCKKKDELFPSVPLESTPIISESGESGRGGCFDTGIGKLAQTTRIVTINTGKMTVGTLYVVQLIVQKAAKQSAKFEQQIEIVKGDPPQLKIT